MSDPVSDFLLSNIAGLEDLQIEEVASVQAVLDETFCPDCDYPHLEVSLLVRTPGMRPVLLRQSIPALLALSSQMTGLIIESGEDATERDPRG